MALNYHKLLGANKTMKHYLLQKLFSLFLVLFGISLAAFVLGILTPGNPAELALSKGGYSPTPEQIKEIEIEMGLDVPYPVQYVKWLNRVLHGDLGTSYASSRPVRQELIERIPITLKLGSCAMVVTCINGILIGCIAAAFRGKGIDKIVQLGINISLSLPAFWFALLLILFFSESLGWLPTSGNGGIRFLIMPTTVLALPASATAARLMRSSLLAEFGKPYYLAAIARGTNRFEQIIKNALPNAIVPVIALMGNTLGGLLGGSVIVETIFALPGIGSYAIEAIYGRDYPALQGYVLVTGCVYVLVSLLVDGISLLLDPKVRVGRRRL
ncbi:ABC transporter permease [Sporanaerobium hydrogeniformans]|uniref:ABC transporter permease n=1 Tax=Sporanaerobium hydrogeniformans TaxID=3072179 RepID=UPI0027E53A21|nr:ABC transporter permease [Sporanaerobium hydrogeniformans]